MWAQNSRTDKQWRKLLYLQIRPPTHAGRYDSLLKKETEECYTIVCLKNIDISRAYFFSMASRTGWKIFSHSLLNIEWERNLINGELSDITLLFCRLYANRLNNNSRLRNTGAKLIENILRIYEFFLTDDSNALTKLSPNLDIIGLSAYVK